MHRALDALLHHGAGHLVRLVYIAVEMVIVGVAAARADKFRKAVPAFFSREQTGIFEFFPNLRPSDPVAHVSHIEILVPRELVTGIEIAVRNDGKVFVSGPAGGDPFGKARPAFEIDIEMEEVETLPLRVALQIFVAEIFILPFYCGKVFFLYL